MKWFCSIPGIAVYIYVINVLAQYGWNIYYQIPSTFIDASIASNTTFMYMFIKGVLSDVKIHPFIYLIYFVVIVGATLIAVYLKGSKYFVITIVAILIGWRFYDFGLTLAKVNDTFFVTESGCLSEATSTRYISPTIYQDEAVFIPIDQNNKMKGGFLVKNLTQMSCLTKIAQIGQVTP